MEYRLGAMELLLRFAADSGKCHTCTASPADPRDFRSLLAPTNIAYGIALIVKKLLIATLLFGLFKAVSAYAATTELCTEASRQFEGINKSEISAGMERLEKAAQTGSFDAVTALATLKLCGIFSDADEQEGIRLLRTMAGIGHGTAQVILHDVYMFGIGVEKDEAEARKWLERAVRSGNANAQLYLGTKYAKGQGVDKDLVEARRWFSMSAAQGNGYAQNMLAMLDFQERVPLTRQAAENGQAEAQEALARMYESGVTGALDKDESEALKWREKAAEGGVAESQRKLGDLYREMPGHKAESLKWYRAAATQGDFESQMRLGGTLQYTDPLESHKWYLMAAERGEVTALYAVARQLAEGPVELRDEAEAFKWYRRLAKLDYHYAAAGLSVLYKNDTKVTPIPGLSYVLEIIGRRQDTFGLDRALEVFPSPEVSTLPPEKLQLLKKLATDLVKPDDFMDVLDAFVRENQLAYGTVAP